MAQMKRNTKTLLWLVLVMVFACILYVWVSNSPVVDDYLIIHDRDTEIDLVFAFATALRINHPDAYDMINVSLKSRLDEWMNTHQSKKCAYVPDVFLAGADIDGNYDVSFGCYGDNDWIDFEIDNIEIEDMMVVDWGEIREDD